ncbi:DUF2188 domain-containing protein [Methanobacterium paludis]|uniref:DUF2188 domain-containing protein n=1 Tax=Methanobacterium paludis (strain DSM 25820 / JCM 18151 / SWAN1) TaxID=868131 RepID=F6D6M5_METPW|nr:DUF2188 domain-containing protein [Methanobacterium paludis]AEG17738.1 hypothetical protein MSWAN_0704 [Methanobacterium paludis]
MTKKKSSIHVVSNEAIGKWQVEKEGAKRASRNCDTKAEAVAAAKAQGKKEKVEVLTHNKDGKIRDRVSYGDDNSPPKDKN